MFNKHQDECPICGGYMELVYVEYGYDGFEVWVCGCGMVVYTQAYNCVPPDEDFDENADEEDTYDDIPF